MLNEALADDGPATISAETTAPSKTFIRATEVWTPDAESGRLVLASGVYGGLEEFAELSGRESFGHGEGLPGKAWAEARPVVLKAFRGSYFKRTEAAEQAGLTAGVAVPVFAGHALNGVLVFLCGDDEAHVGAIEIWRGDGLDGSVMALDDGYYGTAEHFEWISRRTQFPRGAGLPGAVWDTGGAALFHDLGASHRFLRADSAAKAGLTTGLGLPVPTPSGGVWALTLLSALGAPIARRFEIWERGSDSAFVYADGVCEAEGEPYRFSPAPIARRGHGLIGRVIETGVPLAASGVKDWPGNLPESAAAHAGFGALVAMPIHREGRLAQVAAWYF